jgi:hypothetical protein
MDRPKNYTIWNGKQALFNDWSEPPQKGQSVLLAFDQPSRPRFVNYTTILESGKTPDRQGQESQGFIAEGSYFIIYTPQDGFINPTDDQLFQLKLPGNLRDEIARQNYRSFARYILNKYQRVINHARAQEATKHAAATSGGQTAEQRQLQLRAALAAFMAQQDEATRQQPTIAPAPQSAGPDQAKSYAELTPAEQHAFLLSEAQIVWKELEVLGRTPMGSLPASQREGHTKSILDTRAYLGRITKETRRVENILGITSRPSFRGGRRPRGGKALPGGRRSPQP